MCDLFGADCFSLYPSCQGTNLSWIGDGYCNQVFNNEACGFDGGDCCESSCVGSCLSHHPLDCIDPRYDVYANCTAPRNMIGDGLCDSVGFNKECDWDGGDCDDFYANCQGDRYKIGNGICDSINKNENCGWDGNDCQLNAVYVQPTGDLRVSSLGITVGILFVVACCGGVCVKREEEQMNDRNQPARDTARRQDAVPEEECVEERREKITQALIIKRVLSAEPCHRRSRLSIVATSLRKSDRVYSSFVAAFSGSRRSVEFSDELIQTEVGAFCSDVEHENGAPSTSLPDTSLYQLDASGRLEERDSDSDEVGRVEASCEILRLEEEGAQNGNKNTETRETDKISQYQQTNKSGNEHEKEVDAKDRYRNVPSRYRRKSNVVARRLSRSILSLTSIKDQDENPTECNICLMNYEVGEEVCWSPNSGCSHAFHKECLVNWLMKNPFCPCCRRNYLENDEGEGNV